MNLSTQMNRKTLSVWKDREDAINAANRHENVAFIRDGKFLTCSRSYVSNCINAGQQIEVLCDHDNDE